MLRRPRRDDGSGEILTGGGVSLDRYTMGRLRARAAAHILTVRGVGYEFVP